MPYKKVIELCAPWTQNKRLKLSSTIENDEDPHSLRLYIRSMNQAEVPIQMAGDNVDPAFLQALRQRLAPQKILNAENLNKSQSSSSSEHHHEVAIDAAINNASGKFQNNDNNKSSNAFAQQQPENSIANNPKRRELPTSIVLYREVRWRRAIIDTFDLTIVLLSMCVIFANLAAAVQFYLNAQPIPFYVMTAVAGFTSIITASVFSAFFKEQVLQEWNILLIWFVSVPFASVLPLIAYLMRLDETKLFSNWIRSDSKTVRWICRHSLVILVAFIQSYPQTLFLVMAMIYFQTATEVQIFAVVLSAITVLLRFMPLLFEKLGMNLKVMLIVVCAVVFDLSSTLYTCVSVLEQQQSRSGGNLLIADTSDQKFYPLFANAANDYRGIIYLSWAGYGWFITAFAFAVMFTLTALFSLGIKGVRDTLGSWLLIYALLSPLAALFVPIAVTLKVTVLALLYADRYYHSIMAAKSAIVAAALLKTGVISGAADGSPGFDSPQLPFPSDDGKSAFADSQTDNIATTDKNNNSSNTDEIEQITKSATSFVANAMKKTLAKEHERSEKQERERDENNNTNEDDIDDVNDFNDSDGNVISGAAGDDGQGGMDQSSQDVSLYSRAKIGAGGLVDGDLWESTVMPIWLRFCIILFAIGQLANIILIFCHYAYFNHTHKPEQMILFWTAVVCLGGGFLISILRMLEAHRVFGILGDLATVQMLLGGADLVSKEQLDVATRAFDTADEDEDEDENNNSEINGDGDDHASDGTSAQQLSTIDSTSDYHSHQQQQKEQEITNNNNNNPSSVRESTNTRRSTASSAFGSSNKGEPTDGTNSNNKKQKSAKTRWNFLVGTTRLFSLRNKKKSEEQRLLEEGATTLPTNPASSSRHRLSSLSPAATGTNKYSSSQNSLAAARLTPRANADNNDSNINNNNDENSKNNNDLAKLSTTFTVQSSATTFQQNDQLSPKERQEAEAEAEAEERAAKLFVNTLLDEEDGISPLERVSHRGRRMDMCRSFTATRVTNGRRNSRVACVGNSRCTEISRTYVNTTVRNFSVTFKVEKFCDDDIAVGLIGREYSPYDLIDTQCWRLENSVAIVFRERMVAPAIFVKNKPLVVLPQWQGEIIAKTVSIHVLNGFVNFDVNGTRLNCPGLSEFMLSGLFRFGVCLPKKGQSVLIRGINNHSQSQAERETARFLVQQPSLLVHPSSSDYTNGSGSTTTNYSNDNNNTTSKVSFAPQQHNSSNNNNNKMNADALLTTEPSTGSSSAATNNSSTGDGWKNPFTLAKGQLPLLRAQNEMNNNSYNNFASASSFGTSYTSASPDKYLHRRLPEPHNPANDLQNVESLVLPGMEDGDLLFDQQQQQDPMSLKKQATNSEWTLMGEVQASSAPSSSAASKPQIIGGDEMIRQDQVLQIKKEEAKERAKKIEKQLSQGIDPHQQNNNYNNNNNNNNAFNNNSFVSEATLMRGSFANSEFASSPNGGGGGATLSRQNSMMSVAGMDNTRSTQLFTGQGQRLRAQLLRRQGDSVNVGESDILTEIQSSLGPLGYCIYFASIVALVVVLVLVILWRGSSNPITILYSLRPDDFDKMIHDHQNDINNNSLSLTTTTSSPNNYNNDNQDDDGESSSPPRNPTTGYLPSGQSLRYRQLVSFDWQCNAKNATEIAEDLFAAGYFLSLATHSNINNQSNSSNDNNIFNTSAIAFCVKDLVPQLANRSTVCSKTVQEAWWSSVCLAAHSHRPCVVKYMLDLACSHSLGSIRFCPLDFTESDTGKLLCDFTNTLVDPEQRLFGVIQGERPLLTLGKKSQLVPVNNSNPNIKLDVSSCSFNLQTNVVFTPYSWLVIAPLFEIAVITITQLGLVRLAFWILYKIAKFFQYLRQSWWCGCCYAKCCEGCREWAGNDQTPLFQQRMHSSMLFDQIAILGERAKNSEFYHAGFSFSAFGWAFGHHAERAHRYRVLNWRRLCVPTNNGCEWRIAEYTLRRYDLEDPYRYEDVLLVSNDLLVILMDVPLILCYIRVIGFVSNVIFAFLAVTHLWSEDGYHAYNVFVVHLINSSVFAGLMFCMYPVTPDSFGPFFVSPLLGPIDECASDCTVCAEKRNEAKLESRILNREDALALADEVHHFELSFWQKIPFITSRVVFISVVFIGIPHILAGSVIFPATLMGVAICALVFVYVAVRVKNHVTIIVMLFMMRLVGSVILTAAFQSSTNYAALLWFHEGFNPDPNNIDDKLGGGNYFYIVQREFDSRSVMCYIEIIRDSVKNAAGALNLMQIYQFLFGS